MTTMSNPLVAAACAGLAAGLRAQVQALRAGTAAAATGTALPPWADAAAIVSLSLALDGGSGTPRLDIALADGVPGALLPARWHLPGGASLRLRAVRAPRLQAQAAPTLVPAVCRTSAPRISGTATALVRDRLAIDRFYLLTCGHVVAPNAGCRVDERVEIRLPSTTATDAADLLDGRLAEWLPAMGGEALPTAIDAALVEVKRSDAVALVRQGGLLAAGVGGRARLDQPVSLRRRVGPLAGALKIHWSGWVDLPALTPGVADYFLDAAVGYQTGAPTQAGDSGAALWDADEALIGMHLGAIPDARPGSANAVMAPIGPVLDWFAVQPWLRDDPADFAARPPGPQRVAPALPAAVAADSGTIRTIVAQTLWAEAAGEGRAGMAAVASVIRTRCQRQWRGKTDAAAVCLDHKQFSCWNDGSPLLGKMEKVLRTPDAAFRIADELAGRMLADDLPDSTDGATHYVATSLRPLPRWLDGALLCRVIGQHAFYKGIA